MAQVAHGREISHSHQIDSVNFDGWALGSPGLWRGWRATHSLSTEVGTLVLCVMTGTHPSDAPSRQDDGDGRAPAFWCGGFVGWVVVVVVAGGVRLCRRPAHSLDSQRINLTQLCGFWTRVSSWDFCH